MAMRRPTERPSDKARWQMEYLQTGALFCANLGRDAPAVRLESHCEVEEGKHPWALAVGESCKVSYQLIGRSATYVVRRSPDASGKQDARVELPKEESAAAAPAKVEPEPARDESPGIDRPADDSPEGVKKRGSRAKKVVSDLFGPSGKR